MSETQEDVLFRVMLSDNIIIKDMGDYFIRGSIVDKNNRKLENECDSFIFCGDKERMAEKGLMVSDCLIKSENGHTLVRVKMLEGGNKSLHTGTTLGYVERLSMEDTEKKSIFNLSISNQQNEVKKVKEIIERIENSILPDISNDDKESMMKIIRQHKDVFSKYKMDIGETNLVEHQIDTENNKPVAFKPRRIPRGLEQDVNKIINEMLKEGIVRPSTSAWNFPIVVVKKKNGDIRMCVDYRALNAKTARPIFPIPSSEEIFDSVSGSAYFN